jgi:hypothetical protein
MNMTNIQPGLANTLPVSQRDDLAARIDDTWDAMFAMDHAEVEKFQLSALRRRFEELVPRVAVLKNRADKAGITRIDSLEDAVPLLFDHVAYKAYPISLIEKKRFDLLTRWLGGLTSVDLSDVEAAQCTGIDQWLDLLERETELRVYHTSGTSGKLSFIPRSVDERAVWNQSLLKIFEPFGSEPGLRLGNEDARMPVIFPNVGKGRYTAQHLIPYLRDVVAPTPEDCHILDGAVSADVVALSGRIRLAQAKGTLAEMTITEEERSALREYLGSLEGRAQRAREFLLRMADQLAGKRVFVGSITSILVPAAQEGLKRGVEHVFAPGSLGFTGGGTKDAVIPDNWEAMLTQFTGVAKWQIGYAMTEQSPVMPRCPQGRYHIPAYSLVFLLDPATGAPLPRAGTQTGRFAAFDILVQTYWGGIVSGDKVTVEWDGGCPCGRKGAFIHDNITRYSAIETGDDKVTCSATIDNSDAAFQTLLAG